MSATMHGVVPVDEVVHIRSADERQVMVECDPMRLFVVAITVDDFNAVQLSVLDQRLVQRCQFGAVVGRARRTPRVIPEYERALGVGRGNGFFNRPLLGELG